MSATPLEPLRFDPILKPLIWGGRRLGSLLDKPIGDGPCYAESWEISDHRDDVSRVADGPLAGTPLRDLIRERGREIFGPGRVPEDGHFPLLVKFLDAHQVLSVQVHPDDDLGFRLVKDRGKTEAWVILHAEPGSLIYAGLRRGVARSDFARAIESGEVEPLLHRFEPAPGDCVMIPAGTVHAIGAGIVLAEIQQMSDATFRAFDWNRVGADGRPRTLHIAEVLEATDYAAGPVDPIRTAAEAIPGGTREPLARCPYFAIERLRLTGPASVGSADRFTIAIGLEGSAEIRHPRGSTPIQRGQTVLLPASLGAIEVAPGPDGATLLTCIVP